MFRYEATILGVLDSKSNSRKIVRGRGGAKHIIKSAAARRFVDDAVAQLGTQPEPMFTGKVSLVVTVYYPDERRDLDVALFCDVLQTGSEKNPMANIIANDRQIRELHIWHGIDKQLPRLEFVLLEIPEVPKSTFASFLDWWSN